MWAKKLLVLGSTTQEELESFVGTLISTHTAVWQAPMHLRFLQILYLFSLKQCRNKQRNILFLILRIENILLVAAAKKAFWQQRPPFQRYHSTYDVRIILIENLGKNETLSLKQLSFKTVFLVAFSTLSRYCWYSEIIRA